MTKIELGRTGPEEPSFFQRRKGPANMKAGNSAAVAAWGAYRRWIRDGVDGSDKKQQANQPDGIFAVQLVPE
jgi:hypothetical protein